VLLPLCVTFPTTRTSLKWPDVYQQSRVHDVEELLDSWHGLQQSAVDTSAIDEELFFAPVYGTKEVILSCGDMLIE